MGTYVNKFEIGDKVVITNLGGQYLSWLYMSGMFMAKNYCQAKAVTNCIVLNYTLHPNHKKFVYLIEADNGEQHLYEEKSLDHIRQGEQETGQASTRTVIEDTQQYKQRDKWVKNTGEKPDLSDGTLVKVVFKNDCTGFENTGAVETWYWGDDCDDCTIDKWKLADDWNKVVDGKAPDIDPSTLVEVKNMKEHGGYKVTKRVDELHWDMVKKWRYAKKD